MKYFTRDNITVKFPAYFALFIINCPVLLDLAPGNELAALAFASLIKLFCIQYVAEKRKKMFPWIRIWPLYGIAAGHLLITSSDFYFMNNNPNIFYAVAGICVVSMGACGYFLDNRTLSPQNVASLEEGEIASPYNITMKRQRC